MKKSLMSKVSEWISRFCSFAFSAKMRTCSFTSVIFETLKCLAPVNRSKQYRAVDALLKRYL